MGETLLIALGVAAVLALITCFAVKSSMKSARMGVTATQYITDKGVDYIPPVSSPKYRKRITSEIRKASVDTLACFFMFGFRVFPPRR